MVVDGDGRAYVGNFGFDLDGLLESEEAPATLFEPPGPPRTGLVRIDPDGTATVAADGLAFPNGTVITPDGGTLIVAESVAGHLTAFDRDTDGTLSNRRVWAAVPGLAPDGMCLDADGCVWVANAAAPECLRVAEGGGVIERVSTSQNAFACMLGGDDRRTLFVVTAPTSTEGVVRERTDGKIEQARVSVPGAGWPRRVVRPVPAVRSPARPRRIPPWPRSSTARRHLPPYRPVGPSSPGQDGVTPRSRAIVPMTLVAEDRATGRGPGDRPPSGGGPRLPPGPGRRPAPAGLGRPPSRTAHRPRRPDPLLVVRLRRAPGGRRQVPCSPAGSRTPRSGGTTGTPRPRSSWQSIDGSGVGEARTALRRSQAIHQPADHGGGTAQRGALGRPGHRDRRCRLGRARGRGRPGRLGPQGGVVDRAAGRRPPGQELGQPGTTRGSTSAASSRGATSGSATTAKVPSGSTGGRRPTRGPCCRSWSRPRRTDWPRWPPRTTRSTPGAYRLDALMNLATEPGVPHTPDTAPSSPADPSSAEDPADPATASSADPAPSPPSTRPPADVVLYCDLEALLRGDLLPGECCELDTPQGPLPVPAPWPVTWPTTPSSGWCSMPPVTSGASATSPAPSPPPSGRPSSPGPLLRGPGLYVHLEPRDRPPGPLRRRWPHHPRQPLPPLSGPPPHEDL